MEQANRFFDSIFEPLESTFVGSTYSSNDRKQQQQDTFLRAIETPQTPWGKRYETYQLEPQENKQDLLDKIFENFGWELCHGEEDKDIIIKALAADEDVARILSTPKSKLTSKDMHQLKGIVIHQLRKCNNPDPISLNAELRDDDSFISSLSCSYPPDANYKRNSLLAFKGKSLTEEIRQMEEAKQRKLEEEKRNMLEEEKKTLQEEKKKIEEEKKQMEEKHRKMLEDATQKIQEEKLKLEEERKKIKEAKLEEERKKIKEVKLEEERKKIREEKELQEQKAKERKLQKVLQKDLSSTDGDVMGLFSFLNSCCAVMTV